MRERRFRCSVNNCKDKERHYQTYHTPAPAATRLSSLVRPRLGETCATNFISSEFAIPQISYRDRIGFAMRSSGFT